MSKKIPPPYPIATAIRQPGVKFKALDYYKDEPLMVAHLLGGANGVDFTIDDNEIERRVAIAIKYGKAIRKQLKRYDETNQRE